jgi:hypothetical protein
MSFRWPANICSIFIFSTLEYIQYRLGSDCGKGGLQKYSSSRSYGDGIILCPYVRRQYFNLLPLKHNSYQTHHILQNSKTSQFSPKIYGGFHTILSIDNDYIPKEHSMICRFDGDKLCFLSDINWNFEHYLDKFDHTKLSGLQVMTTGWNTAQTK